MTKELHIWLDKVPTEINLTLTVNDVYKHIANNERVIHTTNTHFCNTTVITRYNYHIYIHPTKDRVQEITLGTCAGTRKEIRREHNLEKLLYSNCFGDLIKTEHDYIATENKNDLDRALDNLNVIEKLTDNWFDDGSGKPFSLDHVNRVRRIVKSVSVVPHVFPTATGAIQLEWENDYIYIEVQIFESYLDFYFSVGYNLDYNLELEIKYGIEYANLVIEYLLQHVLRRGEELTEDDVIRDLKAYII